MNTQHRVLSVVFTVFAALLLWLPVSVALGADPLRFYVDDIEIFRDGRLQAERTREARDAYLGELTQIQFLAAGNVVRLLADGDMEDHLLCERSARGVLADEYVCDSPYPHTITIRKAGAYVHGAVMSYDGPVGWGGDVYTVITRLRRR